MIIDCISDLHGRYPKLEGGDLLIVAGDLTAEDTCVQHIQFQIWLHDQNYSKKIVISGNHDNRLQELGFISIQRQYAELGEDYLCDSGTEFVYSEPIAPPFGRGNFIKKLKIWGSPWTRSFPKMNPHCMAFTEPTEETLESHFKRIPSDIDILITHSPPYERLDLCVDRRQEKLVSYGSKALREQVDRINPKLHVFGHLHMCGGQRLDMDGTTYVNAAIMDEACNPVHKPLRVIL